MTPDEMTEVFDLINSQHPAAPHKLGRSDVNAWLALLDPSMSWAEAYAGIREWYSAQSGFIKPAALNQIVKSNRAQRLAAERRAAMGESTHDCIAMQCGERGAVSFRDWSARNPDLAAMMRKPYPGLKDVNAELVNLGY